MACAVEARAALAFAEAGVVCCCSIGVVSLCRQRVWVVQRPRAGCSGRCVLRQRRAQQTGADCARGGCQRAGGGSEGHPTACSAASQVEIALARAVCSQLKV